MGIQCFVVSMKRSADRRERVAREFNRAGIPFEIVDAIDGRTISMRRISPTLGIPMSAADIACTMSHGLAMKAALDRGCERAAIFEDDATLVSDFRARLSIAMAAPVSWDFLKLSGFAVPEIGETVEHSGHLFIRPELPSGSGQGYVITKVGAEKLIPFAARAYDCFDFMLRQQWATKLSLVEVLPRLVFGDRTVPSTIVDRDYHTRTGKWRRRAHKLRRSVWKRLRV